MKELILAAAGITALISSLSALAGPDWAVIEKARAAKKAGTHEAQMRQPMTSDQAAMMKACQEIMQLNEAVAAIPCRAPASKTACRDAVHCSCRLAGHEPATSGHNRPAPIVANVAKWI